MNIFERNFLCLIVVLCFVGTAYGQSTITPYTKSTTQARMKPFERDFELEYRILQQQQANYDYIECVKFLNAHIELSNTIVQLCSVDEEGKCKDRAISFNNSSWLKSAYSVAFNDYSYSFVETLEGNVYVFKYIGHNMLGAWSISDSPGRFYHKHIKEEYSLVNCMNYYP